jgi:hypothetical protein
MNTGKSALMFCFLLGTLPAVASAWEPPVGIPRPGFGIDEVAPVYDQTNPLHYWISGLTACNDANNGGRGSPSAPRCTVPSSLSAGSYVAVASLGINTAVRATGTSAAPVWIAGAGQALVQPKRVGTFLSVTNSSYLIVDGLTFDGTGTPNTSSSAAWSVRVSHHIGIRRSAVRNMPAPPYNPIRFSSGGAGAWYGSLTALVASGRQHHRYRALQQYYF